MPIASLLIGSLFNQSGTVWWIKTRYCLRDDETGDGVTLLVHGVLSFLHEGERAVTVWTATSRSERTLSQDRIPIIEVDERAWSVIQPVTLPTITPPEKSAKAPVTWVQSCFQLAPRVSGASLSLRSQEAQLFSELILPSLRNMMHEVNQGMENHFCDEMRRRN